MGFGDDASPRPLKEKLRSASRFSCCFRGRGEDDERPTSLIRSSSSWLKQELPELKERCRALLPSIGGHRRRASGGGFGYDPLSYALNFDNGDGEHGAGGDFRCPNFSSRLPASPRPPVAAAIRVACQ